MHIFGVWNQIGSELQNGVKKIGVFNADADAYQFISYINTTS